MMPAYQCPYCYQSTGTDQQLKDNDTLQCFACKKLFTFYLGTTQVMQSVLDTQEGGDHYKKMAIQPVEYIVKNKLGYLAGNVIKYVSRNKNGAEDIRKARHYCEMILEFEYDEKPEPVNSFNTSEQKEINRLQKLIDQRNGEILALQKQSGNYVSEDTYFSEIRKRDEVIIGLQQVNRELVEAAKEDHKKITELQNRLFSHNYLPL